MIEINFLRMPHPQHCSTIEHDGVAKTTIEKHSKLLETLAARVLKEIVEKMLNSRQYLLLL